MTETNIDKREMLPMLEMAKRHHMTKQALHIARKKGRLKAHFVNNQWLIHEKDMIAYKASKYNREKSHWNGEPLFREEKEEISVRQASKLTGLSMQTLYYFARSGKIPYVKKGKFIVLTFDGIKEYFTKDTKQLMLA